MEISLLKIDGDVVKGFNKPHSRDKITKAEFPDGIKIIGKDAFAKWGSLQELDLPASLSTIQEGAFKQCSSLKKLNVLGSALTEIQKEAFSECTDLNDITLPNSIIKLGEKAFNKCTSLEKITLPTGITKIERDLLRLVKRSRGGILYQCGQIFRKERDDLPYVPLQ